MKKNLISLIFLLVILPACDSEETDSNKETNTNYYFSLSGESDHWKMNGYEIIITPEGYKVGNGKLTMKNEDEYEAEFFDLDIYSVVDGEKNSLHGRSISSEGTDIAEQTIGATEGEDDALTDPAEIDEIHAVISWNEEYSDVKEDQKETLVLYSKDENDETFLKPK